MNANWVIAVVLLWTALGCGPSGRGGDGDGNGNGHGGDAKPACVGLECRQDKCSNGTQTTISGTVYAPNGTLPLYNAAVYIPNAPVSALPVGVSCDRCGTPLSGAPLVSALSDYKGNFQLVNAPTGTDIPLVIQVGKWRRQVVIPAVQSCQDNVLTDANLTRLPKKQSEGNMPRIAVTLGACDKISCMLPKIGIDASEFGGAGQNKAVTFYTTQLTTGPAGSTSATPFWSNVNELAKYDMVILSCECSEAPNTKNATSYQAMANYLAMGGRVFSTDFQYAWYRYSPDAGLKAAGNIQGGAPVGGNQIRIDASFPKGKALADWLDYTHLSATYGIVEPSEVFDNYLSMDPMKSQTFARSATAPDHPRFMTINTPVGMPPDQQCGKAVHLDAHINSSDFIDTNYPAGCLSPMSSGEGAFAFFFFDLASCIQDDSEPPIL